MMKELEAFKIAAEQRMDQQKVTYEDKLRLLEGTLVKITSSFIKLLQYFRSLRVQRSPRENNKNWKLKKGFQS